MKPEVDQILSLSAAQLMGSLVPQLPAGYAQGSASVLGVMLMLSAQEYDRAAAIRVAENADMRALFRAAAADISDGELRSALLGAADSHDAALTISALDAANAELRRVLIRLQIHAEERGLKAIEARIWAVLKASAERRLVRLG